MAITKTIKIDGQDVLFKASAALPRIYRCKYGRDIFKDFQKLQENVSTNEQNASMLDIGSLEVFENIAFLMARHADDTGPNDIDEWLESFNVFSIYEVLPELIQLWGMNMDAQSKSKKKPKNQSVK